LLPGEGTVSAVGNASNKKRELQLSSLAVGKSNSGQKRRLKLEKIGRREKPTKGEELHDISIRRRDDYGP